MSMQSAISVEGALRRLLAEIAVGDYRDALRHRLVMNTAYIDAVTILELSDLLGAEQDRPPGG